MGTLLKKVFSKENLPIVGILLLAAFLRLYKIGDYMTFLGDEGRDVLVAYNIVHGHFTLLGPTASVGGFFLGPIYYYFIAPFLFLFNYDPVGPAVMIAIFGIFATFFVYKIGMEFFNKTTGIIAAALFAVSPLVIAYSRSSWNPNPMPLFTMATLYSLYKAIKKNSLMFFVITGILYGIDLQLHYIEVFIGVVLITYILLTRILLREGVSLRRMFLQIGKDFLFLAGGFIIGYSPFLAFEVRHGFPDFRSITNFVFHSQNVGSGMNFFAIVDNVFFRVFGRLVTDFPPPEQVSLQAHPYIAVWYYLTLLLGILCIGLLLWQLYSHSGKRGTSASRIEQFQKYLLIFLWFFFGVVLFGFYNKPIYDYYFEFMFPVPFLLVGNLLSFIFTKNIFAKVLGVVVFTILFAINLQAMPFRF